MSETKNPGLAGPRVRKGAEGLRDGYAGQRANKSMVNDHSRAFAVAAIVTLHTGFARARHTRLGLIADALGLGKMFPENFTAWLAGLARLGEERGEHLVFVNGHSDEFVAAFFICGHEVNHDQARIVVVKELKGVALRRCKIDCLCVIHIVMIL